jgi:RepB DNA-primase from phage plasmid
MKRIANHFLTRCFAPSETIALLLRRESAASTLQRIVPLERALVPRYLGWLAHQNTEGFNIYVAANPLRSSSRRRTKENIAAIRHLYIDIDVNGEARLAALRASDLVPTPTAILSTSSGKYQVLWRVEGFDFDVQEATLKLIAIAFGGDPACTDCNRVLRLPGFANCKYDPAQTVTIEYLSDATWNPEDFRLHVLPEAAVLARPTVHHIRPDMQTASEHDWAWVVDELAHGTDAVMLTDLLALRREDKPNPRYYAQRTVDMASARLWLLEGTTVSDVVAMLESRRRCEIPAEHCCARAREIAVTAQRMIGRRKFA